MASDPQGWPEVTIGDLLSRAVIQLHKDGNHGSAYPRASEFVTEGIPFLTAKLVDDAGRIDIAAAPRLSDERASQLRFGFVQHDDVLLSHNATVGRVAIVPEYSGRLLVGTSLTCFRLDKARLLPQYLAAFFQGKYFQNQLSAVMGLSTRSQVPVTTQRSLRVVVPPMFAQRAIASMLGVLDERIDLLRQTNATVESIARALFKSWFVDFDPVRAKAEGREPEGMDAATAALFPAGFEGSELSDIPKGWRIASLQEHITAERGLSYKGAGLAEDGVPMHNLNSVLEGGGYKYSGIKYYRGDYKDRHMVRPGDIIVANTEQGHHHRLIGFPAIVPRSFETGIYSHHLYRVRIEEHSGLTPEWLYHCLMASAVRDQIIGCANGSTVNMLKPAGLQIPRFAAPPRELCAAFDSIAAPIREATEANVARVDNLSALRDSLLPRLISGKLRLPDVERHIEAATA